MLCLLTCCFIGTLLGSVTILVCKLYVFSLICNRYDIKINEIVVFYPPNGIVPSSLLAINHNRDGSPSATHIKNTLFAKAKMK